MNQTYRQQFGAAAKASEYEQAMLHSHSYSEVLWQVEKQQLGSVIADLRRTHPRIESLDFACGTGRITSFVEGLVDASTAIEISPAMLEIARRKLTRTTLINADITPAGTPVEGKYDLITAFRFVLNAEPALRKAALSALVARLRDPTSLIVFNNHGNLLSHKLAMYPFHRLASAGKGWRPEGNYMTGGQIRRLANDVGLRIHKVMGCGLLSSRGAAAAGFERAVRWEGALSRSWLHRFGGDQMYVAGLKTPIQGHA